MQISKKTKRLAVAASLLMLAYGYWVWPTPWHPWSLRQTVPQPYHIVHVMRFFQTNRLDGHIENCTVGMFGIKNCYPITESELQTTFGPLTAAQLQEVHKRW